MVRTLFAAASLLFSAVTASPAVLQRRQNCAQDYSSCAPAGATATALPPVGTDLDKLYTDLLAAVKNVPQSRKAKRDGADAFPAQLMPRDANGQLIARDAPAICCASGTACLNIGDYNVPMCYDHYTTNYILPDGSYGTIDSGNFHAADGSEANLINGSYSQRAGPTGNIYPSSSPLNTATLPVPTPWTASGSGIAIPITALGGQATYTITIPGTTVAASTIPETTVSVLTVSGKTVVTSLVEAPTTVPGTTVAGLTTTITATGTSKAGAAAHLPTQAAGVGAAAGLLVAAIVAL